MIYPDREVVTTTYNSMGLPSTLRSSQVGILVNGNSNGGASYDEAGRLTMMNFPAGGGISHINTYAPWSQQDSNGGMLTGIQVKASNGVDQLNLQYNYDSFGNVAAQTDAGSVTNFSYDAQNRLLNAYDQSYSYDAAGRLTSFEDKTLAPNVTHPHAMQKANALGILSLTGNVLFRDTERGSPQYLTWDEENHLRTVTVNNNPLESYGYDAAGSRVKKSKGTVATYTVNPYYETTGPDYPSLGRVRPRWPLLWLSQTRRPANQSQPAMTNSFSCRWSPSMAKRQRRLPKLSSTTALIPAKPVRQAMTRNVSLGS